MFSHGSSSVVVIVRSQIKEFNIWHPSSLVRLIELYGNPNRSVFTTNMIIHYCFAGREMKWDLSVYITELANSTSVGDRIFCLDRVNVIAMTCFLAIQTKTITIPKLLGNFCYMIPLTSLSLPWYHYQRSYFIFIFGISSTKVLVKIKTVNYPNACSK